MAWRPKGWRTPYNYSWITQIIRTHRETLELKKAFEAGADAMLKALKETALYKPDDMLSRELRLYHPALREGSTRDWLIVISEEE